MCFRLPDRVEFLPPTLFFLSILGDFQGISQFGHTVSHLPLGKTFNKIKKNPTYCPYFKISCNLKHTHFFFA